MIGFVKKHYHNEPRNNSDILIFVRHYYRPDLSKFDQIREKLTKLHGLLQEE